LVLRLHLPLLLELVLHQQLRLLLALALQLQAHQLRRGRVRVERLVGPGRRTRACRRHEGRQAPIKELWRL
jgi:hypothetical protein